MWRPIPGLEACVQYIYMIKSNGGCTRKEKSKKEKSKYQ